jgi:hypothetical protein
MDILNNSDSSSAFETAKSKPILLVGGILVLIAIGFYFFNKNSPSVSFLPQTQSTPVNMSAINIDFTFLNSPEFEALESFPDYPDFRESTGTGTIPAGRVNPFLPPSGINLQTEGTAQTQTQSGTPGLPITQ